MNWKNLAITVGGFILFIFLLFSFVDWIEPIESVKASSLEPGCKVIGSIGNLLVSRCYDDETGAIFYGNSNGWMTNPIE